MTEVAIPSYYWDACIYLEHLRGEPAPAEQRQAIVRLLSENKDKQNRIFTSAVTHIEVLPKKLTKDDVAKEAEYMNMFGSMYFFDIAIDGQVIQLAREIKDFYFEEGDPKLAKFYRMMSTGDAIHLATAIINGATEFHTRDKNSRGGNVKLIGLPAMSPNGKIAGRYDLVIVSPEEKQGNLDVTEESNPPPPRSGGVPLKK